MRNRTENGPAHGPALLRSIAPGKGFTLIELMIVIAIIAIILTLALPTYTNYTVRAKLSEALAVAAAAKTAVASTCNDQVNLPDLDNDAAGYGFSPSTWVESIEIDGPCTEPQIIITTRDTGAPVDPVVTLTGSFGSSAGAITWTCTSTAEDYHLPPTCRGGS